MNKWFELNKKDRLQIINQVSFSTGLPPSAIEKDIWVVFCLRAIYATPCAEHIVFKGGTSLSKAWQVINRFSEDIDLAIDRSYLGYDREMTKTQVRKLRKTSCSFVSNEFPVMLEKAFMQQGTKEYIIEVAEFTESDTDPLSIYVNFESAVEEDKYIKPRVIIELSARSLKEPFEEKEIVSFIGQEYPKQKYSGDPILIPSVLPTRTFLEKIFLLHEEFQKPKVKSERMTRHLYDISRLVETEFCDKALSDMDLYETIVEHRKLLTPVRGIDYDLHAPEHINFIPPKSVLAEWRKDYSTMQESMFYGETESFDDLIAKLQQLNERINRMIQPDSN